MTPTTLARAAPGAMLFVRRAGSTDWVEARLDMIAPNGQALMVSAPEGLGGGGRGFALDLSTRRMVLALLWQAARYVDINTGVAWSLREKDE